MNIVSESSKTSARRRRKPTPIAPGNADTQHVAALEPVTPFEPPDNRKTNGLQLVADPEHIADGMPGTRESRSGLAHQALVPSPSPQEGAASQQLHQLVSSAVVQSLGTWTGFLGSHAIQLTAEKFTTIIIEQTGPLLKKALSDPDVHKIAVNVVKTAIIEAGYLAGGRLIGRPLESVANKIAERFLRNLSMANEAAGRELPATVDDAVAQR